MVQASRDGNTRVASSERTGAASTARQRDHEARPSAVRVRELHAPAVGVGHRLHDGQPEAAAAAGARRPRLRSRSARTPARGAAPARPGPGRPPRARPSRPRAAARPSPACPAACAGARSRPGCPPAGGGRPRRRSPSPCRGGRARGGGRTRAPRPRPPPRAPPRSGPPGAAGTSRPASARASSSRSPTSRRIRRDERSADSAISRRSPSSSDSSSSRLARMLVSGVRSSCEASATNARWRASVASVSLRAALSSWSMSSNVWARSATSSLALRLGQRDVGVARAGHLARRAGEAGDRPHRALGHVQAGDEGEQRAAEHAEGEEEADPVDRGGRGVLRLGVLHEAHRRRQGLVRRAGR